MSVIKKLFGICEGIEIFEYTMSNSAEMVVSVLEFRATIRSIETNDGKDRMRGEVAEFDQNFVIDGRGCCSFATVKKTENKRTYYVKNNFVLKRTLLKKEDIEHEHPYT